MASTVLLYSDDPRVRDRMRLAIGPRPARDLEVEFVECDSFEQTVRLIDEYDVDLLVLDGEASPAEARDLERLLAGLDLAFRHRPDAVIAAREERPARVDEEHLDPTGTAPEHQQARAACLPHCRVSARGMTEPGRSSPVARSRIDVRNLHTPGHGRRFHAVARSPRGTAAPHRRETRKSPPLDR